MIGLRVSVLIGLLSSNSHPDHVGNDGGTAGGHPSGIRAQIAGLHVAYLIGHVARSVSRVVHGCVNHSLIDTVPQDFGRSLDERLDEEDSIKLIDVVLVHDSFV
jgi:hypothetical protein